MSRRERQLSRRVLLLGSGTVALSACTTAGPEPAGGPATTPATPTPTPTPTPPVRRQRLPRVAPWQPVAADVEPQAKLAAARVLEALGTDRRAGPTPAERLEAAGASADLAATAGPLLPPRVPAVSRIVYPQYGGLLSDSASVMTVVEQVWMRDGRRQRRTVTCDVRLERVGGEWQVSELRPVRVREPAAEAGPLAQELLAGDGVDLPLAAQVEAARGDILPALLETLLALGEEFRLSVSVFGAGHPVEVFGTTSTSNHTRGRAADVWAIDGTPVAALPLDSPLLRDVLLAARELGSDEIGGPVVPAGAAPGVYFANPLHRDHVHIGFDP